MEGSGPCISIPEPSGHPQPSPSPVHQSPRFEARPTFCPFCNATPTLQSHFIALLDIRCWNIAPENHCVVGPPPNRAIDIIFISGAPQQVEPGKRLSHANASFSAGSSQPRQRRGRSRTRPWVASGASGELSLAGGQIPFAGQGNESSALPIPSLFSLIVRCLLLSVARYIK